jgi:hypothetical protein
MQQTLHLLLLALGSACAQPQPALKDPPAKISVVDETGKPVHDAQIAFVSDLGPVPVT